MGGFCWPGRTALEKRVLVDAEKPTSGDGGLLQATGPPKALTWQMSQLVQLALVWSLWLSVCAVWCATSVASTDDGVCDALSP